MKMRIPLILLSLFFSVAVSAQVDSTTPPFKKFPELPPVQLLLGDSSTKFTKDHFARGKKVMIMLFSPDCSHCQHETQELKKNKEALKDVQVVMITFHPFEKMKAFIDEYGLAGLKNIVVGKDIYTLLPSFYSVHNLPFHAFYNKKGELISSFEGSMELDAMLRQLEK